jgi:hypothetical protein
MRVICLLFLLFINQETDRTIKGVVLFEDDTMPGVTVTLVNSGDSTISNNDGEYFFSLPKDIKNITLEVSMYHNRYGATTRIENIEIKSDQTNLPDIPFFLAKSIDAKAYNLLSGEEKKHYDPMYHYATLIGYYSRIEIDSAQIRVPCNGKLLKLPYTHIPEGNKVVFNFKDFPDCR